MWVYPLLADLRYSGDATVECAPLCLGVEELNKFQSERHLLMELDCGLYVRPSVISYVQINYCWVVMVDSRSDFLCGWFWANKPMSRKIVTVNAESFRMLSEETLRFREEKPASLAEVEYLVKTSYSNQSIKSLLEGYENFGREAKRNNALF